MVWQPAEAVLVTEDGVRISATHEPARQGALPGLAFVFVHGFTQHHRRPDSQRIIDRLAQAGGVIGIDLRGHGRSTGISTVGKDEVHDVDAAVRWAHRLGYTRVVTIGFSLGGATVLRHGSEGQAPPDAIVEVSAPAFWNYRGTRIMRLVHHLFLTPHGRFGLKTVRGTRVATPESWPEPWPDAPFEAAARLTCPLLIVHGDRDHYFPHDHPEAIERAARTSGNAVEMWIVPGMGHAESATSNETIDAIKSWARGIVHGARAAEVDA